VVKSRKKEEKGKENTIKNAKYGYKEEREVGDGCSVFLSILMKLFKLHQNLFSDGYVNL